jgi:hypothetical protein
MGSQFVSGPITAFVFHAIAGNVDVRKIAAQQP